MADMKEAALLLSLAAAAAAAYEFFSSAEMTSVPYRWKQRVIECFSSV